MAYPVEMLAHTHVVGCVLGTFCLPATVKREGLGMTDQRSLRPSWSAMYRDRDSSSVWSRSAVLTTGRVTGTC